MNRYTAYGIMMTGFDNSSDHTFYGHYSNPEYQENHQIENMSEKEYELYIKKQSENCQQQENDNFDNTLPF